MLAEDGIRRCVVELIRAAATHLPEDVKASLRRAYELEENPLARRMLSAILENVELAEGRGRPICQDTGIVMFSVKAGERFPFLGKLPGILRMAVAEATRKIPLRPNAMDIVTGINTGDNTGDYIPWIDWEIMPGEDYAEITVLLKGGGSEAAGGVAVMAPSAGIEGASRFVLEVIKEAGPRACPPLVIGIGLGGTAYAAICLAKRALLRGMGSRNPRRELALLEEKILEMVNGLGWGVHGVGGITTALDVRIEASHRHPASLAVGVVSSCWAFRYSTMRISGDKVEFLTHEFLNDLEVR
ncbi:MAG: fumarate hydratase [Nitrososphaerota archaeon]